MRLLVDAISHGWYCKVVTTPAWLISLCSPKMLICLQCSPANFRLCHSLPTCSSPCFCHSQPHSPTHLHPPPLSAFYTSWFPSVSCQIDLCALHLMFQLQTFLQPTWLLWNSPLRQTNRPWWIVCNIQFNMPICFCLLGLSLPCYAFSIFLSI